MKCEHLTCDGCYQNICAAVDLSTSPFCCICKVKCSRKEKTAATTSLRWNLEKFKKVYEEVRELRSENILYSIKINQLEMSNLANSRKVIHFEKMNEQHSLNTIGDLKCSECNKSDNETSIQFCNSCLTQNFGIIEDYVEYVRSSDRKFDSIAICAVCAIRNHMKKGHEVTDFYPVLRKFQFDNHSENLKPKRENNQEENDKLKQGMDEVMDVIGEGEEELNKMTEMMVRCKSSALQKCLASKIAQQIGSNFNHVEKFRDVVANWCKIMKDVNNKLKEENYVENATNCDEE